jgi:hypothetical protein
MEVILNFINTSGFGLVFVICFMLILLTVFVTIVFQPIIIFDLIKMPQNCIREFFNGIIRVKAANQKIREWRITVNNKEKR